MKLKRILSLAVVLAMVLSIVPAFSLTASAATVAMPDGGTVVFNGGRYGTNAYSGSFQNDSLTQKVGEPWNKFVTSEGNTHHANLKVYKGAAGDEVFLQIYSNGTTNPNTTSTVLTSHSNAFAKDSEWYAIQFYFDGVNVNNIHQTGIVDADGKVISAFEYHKENGQRLSFLTNDGRPYKNVGGVAGTIVSGKDSFINSLGRWITIIVKNYPAENYYTVTYGESGQNVSYADGDGTINEIATLKYTGLTNGFSGLKFYYAKNNSWDNVRYGGLRVTAGPEMAKADVTVNYVDGETVVGTYTDGNRIVGQSYTPSHSEYYASEQTATLYQVGTPETIKVAASGNVVNIPVTAYKSLTKEDAAASYNLAANGSFEGSDGSFDVTGWNHTNNTGEMVSPQTADKNFFYAVTKDGYYFKGTKYDIAACHDDGNGTNTEGAVVGNPTDGNWYLMGKWNDGWGGLCGLVRNFTLTSGKSYVVQYDVKLNTDSYSNDGNGFRVYTTAEATDSATETGSTAGAITDTWKTVSTFVDATDDTDNLWFRAYNFQNVCLDNVRIYEITALQSSNEVTVQAAIDTAKPNRTSIKSGQTLSLTETVSDGISDPFIVTWKSDNTVISPSEANTVVGAVDSVTKVKLTPSIMWNGTEYTGKTTEVTVFMASRAGGEYNSGSGRYNIDPEHQGNIIANGSFENESGFSTSGWTNQYQNELLPDPTTSSLWFDVTEDGYTNSDGKRNGSYVIPDGAHALGSRWNDNGLVSSGNNTCTIETHWTVPADGTYYLSFYARSEADADSARKIYAYYQDTATWAQDPASVGAQVNTVATTTDWQKYEYVFNAKKDGIIAIKGWYIGKAGNNGNGPYPFTFFDDFELYAAEQQAEDIDTIAPVNITTFEGTSVILPKSVTAKGTLGSDITVDVQWNTTDVDLTTVEGTGAVTGTATYAATGTTKNVTANIERLSTTFTLPDTDVAKSSDHTLKFPEDITKTFSIEFDYTPDAAQNNWIYISKDGALWSGGQIGIGTSNDGLNTLNAQPGHNLGTAVSGTTYRVFVTSDVEKDTYSITVTSPDGTVWAADSTYRTASDAINSMRMTPNGDKGSYSVKNIKVHNPNTTLEDYTVQFSGVTRDSYTAKTTAEAKLGYGNEAIYPNVEIPYIEGYVFTGKTVEGSTVTLNYAETVAGNFFEGVAEDTPFVSLNMLGAHDAFTKNAGTKKDQPAIDRGELDGTRVVLGVEVGKNLSVTQDKTAYELLEAGVRYFDIRLSRSDDTLNNDSYQTHGVYYTTHNTLSDEFRPIAYTIGQWMKEHPGEIVVLDIQEVWDATADGKNEAGDKWGSTAESWRDIDNILTEAGIKDFVKYDKGTSLKNVTYGGMTENGTKAGAILFGRAQATNASVGKFYLRGTTADAFGGGDGKLYSNYDHAYKTGATTKTTIGTKYSADYIQAQVDSLNYYHTTQPDPVANGQPWGGDPNGDHPVFHMARVMQAQSESLSNVLNQGEKDNNSLYTALTENPEWLTALPIVMVNSVGYDTDNQGYGTDDIVKLLKGCNVAKEMTVSYTLDGKEIGTAKKTLMVGTLYTQNANEIINKSGYTNVITTKPSTSTDGKVVYVPSSGNLTVEVAALGNVYGINYGGSADVKGTLCTDAAFPAYYWGGDGTYRVGVAVLDGITAAPSDVENYALTGTRTRWYCDGKQVVTMNFYAVSYDEYVAADLTTRAGFNALISDENLVYSEKKEKKDDDTNATMQTLALDKDIMNGKVSDGKVVILGVATGGLYGMADDLAVKIVQKPLGVSLVNGAQVRIGLGVDDDGKITSKLSDSGLRFIATVNETETLASQVNSSTTESGYVDDNNHYGILIYPESAQFENFAQSLQNGDKNIVVIPAEKMQNGTTFSAALTKLSEKNYNVNFVAKPYVKINGTYYIDDTSVTRSIYYVAAGLMVNNKLDSQENADLQQTTDNDNVVNVLNAYLNQVGVRLTLDAVNKKIDARTEGTGAGAYTGVEFFDVISTEADGVYTITLTAKGDKTTFKNFWTDYVRINNNHGAVINGIGENWEISTDEATGKTTLTFTFDPNNAK